MNASTVKKAVSIMASMNGETVKNIAGKMGHSFQWIDYRIRTEKFSVPEWQELCRICGCNFTINITSKDKTYSITLGDEADEG